MAAEPSGNPASSLEALEPGELPMYTEDGVDLTLIRWMLSLTPAERLQVLQNHLRAVLRVRPCLNEATGEHTLLDPSISSPNRSS